MCPYIDLFKINPNAFTVYFVYTIYLKTLRVCKTFILIAYRAARNGKWSRISIENENSRKKLCQYSKFSNDYRQSDIYKSIEHFSMCDNYFLRWSDWVRSFHRFKISFDWFGFYSSGRIFGVGELYIAKYFTSANPWGELLFKLLNHNPVVDFNTVNFQTSKKFEACNSFFKYYTYIININTGLFHPFDWKIFGSKHDSMFCPFKSKFITSHHCITNTIPYDPYHVHQPKYGTFLHG